MLGLLVFSTVLLVAAPVIAIMALVGSIGLNSRLRNLEIKIGKLERQLAPADSSLSKTATETAAPPARVPAEDRLLKLKSLHPPLTPHPRQ